MDGGWGSCRTSILSISMFHTNIRLRPAVMFYSYPISLQSLNKGKRPRYVIIIIIKKQSQSITSMAQNVNTFTLAITEVKYIQNTCSIAYKNILNYDIKIGGRYFFFHPYFRSFFRPLAES